MGLKIPRNRKHFSAVRSSENSENLINGKNQWKKIDKKQTNKLKEEETTSRA